MVFLFQISKTVPQTGVPVFNEEKGVQEQKLREDILSYTPQVTLRNEQSLGGLVTSLTSQNYLASLNSEFLQSHIYSIEQKAQYCELISKYASGHKLSELERQFLFELASAFAPSRAALGAQEDYALPSAQFRTKNGGYQFNWNNCRHYTFKKYYPSLEHLIDPAHGKMGRNIYGRPSNFDYKGSDHKITRVPYSDWKSYSLEKKEACLRGRPVYVMFVFPKKDIKKALEFLEPGDLVGVERNPRTTNPHVGICGPDKNIIHIGRPLYRDSLADFAKRSGSIIIYKLATRDLRPPDLSLSFEAPKLD